MTTNSNPTQAPMLPIVRDALTPLLDQLPPEHRMDVRNFTRYAAGLAYANGYGDGHEDGVADEQAASREDPVAPVIPLQRPDAPRAQPLRSVDGPTRCAFGYATSSRRLHCELDAGHSTLLHQHTDFPAKRLYLWAGAGQLLTVVMSDALDALLRSLLFDADPDPERLRRLAQELSTTSLKDLRMKTHLIAHTAIDVHAMAAATEENWSPFLETTDMDSLAEFAGRGCYQSWDRPNPATRENADYLAHINEVGHFSIYRHASMTLYVTGVSRSLTHELVVHKHLAHSQLSQRYVVPTPGDKPVPPPLVANDPAALWVLEEHHRKAAEAYDALLTRLEASYPDAKPKELREAARAVLPNAQETRVTVTGCVQAWRQFVAVRHSWHADAEIREFAGHVLRHLRTVAPNSVQDLPEEPTS